MPIASKARGTGRTREAVASAKKVEKWRESTSYDTGILDSLKGEAAEEAKEVRLHELQERALKQMKTEQYCLVTGQAGTGKTEVFTQAFPTLIERAGLVDIREHLSIGANKGELVPAIACIAFQNKVVRNFASRLDEEYRKNCMTAHKFLGYAPEYYDMEEADGVKMIFEPRYTAAYQHKWKILAIDELGAFPEPLWQNLLAATPPDVQIIAMGDINQLAPVGGRPVLPFAAIEWPTTTLTHIYRQTEGGVIDNAARVLKGEPLIPSEDFRMGSGEIGEAIKNKNLDMKRDCILDADEEIAAKQVALYLMAAMHRKEYNPDTDMVMTYRNEGPLGRIPLNNTIRFFANGQFSPDPEKAKRTPMNIQLGDKMLSYSVGDRVVSISGLGTIDGMPSGTAGIVTKIEPNPEFIGGRMSDEAADELASLFTEADSEREVHKLAAYEPDERDEDEITLQKQSSHVLHIYCPDTDTHATVKRRGEFAALALNWAGTVHRNQGLQHRRVFIIVHSAHMAQYTREWLYTGITRTEEVCTLLYRPMAIEAALAKQFYTGNTAYEKAYNYVNSQKSKEALWLPEPQSLMAEDED